MEIENGTLEHSTSYHNISEILFEQIQTSNRLERVCLLVIKSNTLFLALNEQTHIIRPFSIEFKIEFGSDGSKALLSNINRTRHNFPNI